MMLFSYGSEHVNFQLVVLAEAIGDLLNLRLHARQLGNCANADSNAPLHKLQRHWCCRPWSGLGFLLMRQWLSLLVEGVKYFRKDSSAVVDYSTPITQYSCFNVSKS
uniref:Uncharacterized protein n=1 Tax=Oryza punctata TaxID=4537 RepID=A0A0E0K5X9_ORYPU